MNPQTRIIASFILIISMMLLPWGFSLWFGWALTVILLIVSKLSIKRIGIALYSFLWMVIITLAAHGFTSPGMILFEIKPLHLTFTYDGLIKGTILSFRFLSVILIAVALSHKISSTEGIIALEGLLKPLKKMKLPTGQFVLMVNMSLRFIPVLYEEAMSIRKSLIVRGWKNQKNMLKITKTWVPLFIPVLASGLRRSDDIAESLILRGYDPEADISFFEKEPIHITDLMTYVIVLSPGILHVVMRVGV